LTPHPTPPAPCPDDQRVDFFEKSAPYYDFVLDLLTFRQYAEFQKRAVVILAPEKGEKILDLCSGTGRVSSWMAQAVGNEGEVVGMDISQSMVEVAKKRYGEFDRLVFLNQDVTEPWEYYNYFDGIFTSFAIHELPERKRLEALEHSYLALKEKGRIVIADFNPQASGWRKTVLLAFFKLFEKENLNFFSFDQKEMLRKVGFRKIKVFLVLNGLFQITVVHKN
jgi:demethylmenaquinone methyltransferase/2-methoxy-6-polyprenyl-1,4-benzoquinol methylase